MGFIVEEEDFVGDGVDGYGAGELDEGVGEV